MPSGYLLRCLKCRGKLVPNPGTGKVGAWYCRPCDWYFTDDQIRLAVINQLGAKVIPIRDRP